MTQKDKNLLLNDLSARLPYGVKGLTLGSKTCTLIMLMSDGMFKADTFVGHITSGQFKPYLRPMSSMTEDEENEYRAINCYEGLFPRNEEALDYVLEHHLDFRGLIPMGLALEAPNNMYKN